MNMFIAESYIYIYQMQDIVSLKEVINDSEENLDHIFSFNLPLILFNYKYWDAWKDLEHIFFYKIVDNKKDLINKDIDELLLALQPHAVYLITVFYLSRMKEW